MIYHNTSLRAPLRRPVRDFPSWASKPHTLPTENRSEWRRWFLRPWIVMQPAAWRRFQCDPYLTAKKTKNMTFTKTVNGQAIYCRIVKALANIRRSPDQRIKGDEIPLQGHSIRDRARSVLYIHQVALLPLNLRTVSPIYGETSKYALLLFLVL